MLTLQINFTATTADVLTVVDNTVYGTLGNPTRNEIALVLGIELLSPWQARSTPYSFGEAGYDPRTLLLPNGLPITLTRPADGVLRMVVAAVPIVLRANVLELTAGTAYCTPAGFCFVRGIENDPAFDAVLNAADVLGESTTTAPQVLAYTVVYRLWNADIIKALARLNLRYLGLPFSQQAPMVNLYERLHLLVFGSKELYDQKRYLDAAAVLEGAHKCLATNGQTPDAYAPVLLNLLPTSSF